MLVNTYVYLTSSPALARPKSYSGVANWILGPINTLVEAAALGARAGACCAPTTARPTVMNPTAKAKCFISILMNRTRVCCVVCSLTPKDNYRTSRPHLERRRTLPPAVSYEHVSASPPLGQTLPLPAASASRSLLPYPSPFLLTRPVPAPFSKLSHLPLLLGLLNGFTLCGHSLGNPGTNIGKPLCTHLPLGFCAGSSDGAVPLIFAQHKQKSSACWRFCWRSLP